MSNKIKDLVNKIKEQDYQPYFPEAVGGNAQQEAEDFVYKVLENYAAHFCYLEGYLKLTLHPADYKRACFLDDAILKAGRDNGVMIVFNDELAKACNIHENEIVFKVM